MAVDLFALIEHACTFGRFGLSRIEQAMLDGVVEGYVAMYLRWHRSVWG